MEAHLGPPDLHVHHPDLEDALIALVSDPDANHRSDAAAGRTVEGVS